MQRAAKIASLSPEALRVARETGTDNNQSALLAAAKHTEPERQVAAQLGPKPQRAPREPEPDALMTTSCGGARG